MTPYPIPVVRLIVQNPENKILIFYQHMGYAVAATEADTQALIEEEEKRFIDGLSETYNIVSVANVPTLSFPSGNRLIAFEGKVYRLDTALEPIFDDLCKTVNPLITNSFSLSK